VAGSAFCPGFRGVFHFISRICVSSAAVVWNKHQSQGVQHHSYYECYQSRYCTENLRNAWNLSRYNPASCCDEPHRYSPGEAWESLRSKLGPKGPVHEAKYKMSECDTGPTY